MIKDPRYIPNYFISPGYIYFPEIQTKISTVLGSSVSIAVFDRKKKSGAMSHFLYPSIKNGDIPRSIYGDVSTKALINFFLKEGSRKKNMEAQIFGGAFNSSVSPSDIGKKNVESAKKILLRENINLVSEDIGGTKGRKIVFDTKTNEIVVIRVDNLRKTDWYPYG